MALIDEGETDWKVIAIDINDPLAEKLDGKLNRRILVLVESKVFVNTLIFTKCARYIAFIKARIFCIF